ncbi:putative membrane metal-binding protein [Lachnospiraceae bacterium PF1-22]
MVHKGDLVWIRLSIIKNSISCITYGVAALATLLYAQELGTKTTVGPFLFLLLALIMAYKSVTSFQVAKIFALEILTFMKMIKEEHLKASR